MLDDQVVHTQPEFAHELPLDLSPWRTLSYFDGLDLILVASLHFDAWKGLQVPCL